MEALKNFTAQYREGMFKLIQQQKDQHTGIFPMPQEAIIKGCQFLQEGFAIDNQWDTWLIKKYSGQLVLKKSIESFMKNPAVQLLHAVRFLMMLDYISYNRYSLSLTIDKDFEYYLHYYRRAHKKDFGLMEVADALNTSGIDPLLVGQALLSTGSPHIPFMWPRVTPGRANQVTPGVASSIASFFEKHIEIMEGILGLQPLKWYIDSYDLKTVREKALTIMSQFHEIPGSFHKQLWVFSLDKKKSLRSLAQKCLAHVPEKKLQIIAALKSKKQNERAAAALWLAKLNAADTIPLLKKALDKEKNDAAKNAFMEALEALGVPPGDLIDRCALKNDASETLKKGLPKTLKSYPFDSMPTVHWQDTGDVVDKDIILWLIVLGYKSKTPEPGAALRKYVSLMNRSDCALLGSFILEAWIQQDACPKYSYEEATALATNAVKNFSRWNKGKVAVPKNYFQRCLNGLLEEKKGSAIKEKGILALSAACCDGRSVPSVEAFLKTYYGMRAAQCKALLQMVSWLRYPTAVQLLLSVANRFRTKSIQKEAQSCLNKLAHSQGWSVAQLADRTIPTAG
ncbi:MAG: hypothetical protein GY757_52440, partial [bacterium]|nr:hypothetical protein [bacterium]